MSSQPISQPRTRKGFTPFPNEVLGDWPRLLSGSVQIFMVMYINSETLGQAAEPDTDAVAEGPAPRENWRAGKRYWSRPMKLEELAVFCRSTVRAIQGAQSSLTERGVIEVKESLPRGSYRFHICFDKWPSLPTVNPAEVIPISGDADESEPDPDEGESNLGAVPIFDKPQTVRAGLRPRPKDLPAAASRLRVETNSDVQYTGTIRDGVLSLKLAVIQREQKANAQRSSDRFEQAKAKIPHTGVVDDRSFSEFERTARTAGLSFSSFDLGKAYKLWVKLTAADQRAAIDGLVARHAAGEYADPMYRPLIQNYLLKRTWDRAIRKPASKAELKMEGLRRTVDGALKIAREMDRKAGRS